MLTHGPRGTNDILPNSSGNWQYLEQTIRKVCKNFNYQEIRTPIFEHTELFLRGIGNTTDIVSKEMYTFQDRGGRSLTLRPENTAAVVRSYLENKLYGENYLNKLFYIGPMFRYDRPQAGRYRQFHQFGVEALGADSPLIDSEVILLAIQFLSSLQLRDLEVIINSVGCPKCRPSYRDKLQSFFKDTLQELCTDCKSRYEENPLRILDCKIEKCQQLSIGVPVLTDCLCDECTEHFNSVKEYLTAAGINYTLDNNLVRGLDYYTKTAFEIKYLPLGAQSAVCGGGRYDGLVEECGGNATPGIGFAMGMERILLALQNQELLPEANEGIDVYIVTVNEAGRKQGLNLAVVLRNQDLSCELDFANRAIKGQLRNANKLKAKYAIIIAEKELETRQYSCKNMITGEQVMVGMKDERRLLDILGVSK